MMIKLLYTALLVSALVFSVAQPMMEEIVIYSGIDCSQASNIIVDAVITTPACATQACNDTMFTDVAVQTICGGSNFNVTAVTDTAGYNSAEFYVGSCSDPSNRTQTGYSVWPTGANCFPNFLEIMAGQVLSIQIDCQNAVLSVYSQSNCAGTAITEFSASGTSGCIDIVPIMASIDLMCAAPTPTPTPVPTTPTPTPVPANYYTEASMFTDSSCSGLPYFVEIDATAHPCSETVCQINTNFSPALPATLGCLTNLLPTSIPSSELVNYNKVSVYSGGCNDSTKTLAGVMYWSKSYSSKCVLSTLSSSFAIDSTSYSVSMWNAPGCQGVPPYTATLSTSIDAGMICSDGCLAPSCTTSSDLNSFEFPIPSGTPSSTPSGTPSSAPSGTPSSAPSGTPSSAPSSQSNGSPSSQAISTGIIAVIIVAVLLVFFGVGGYLWMRQSRKSEPVQNVQASIPMSQTNQPVVVVPTPVPTSPASVLQVSAPTPLITTPAYVVASAPSVVTSHPVSPPSPQQQMFQLQQQMLLLQQQIVQQPPAAPVGVKPETTGEGGL